MELGFKVAHHLVVPGMSREYILFEDASREIEAYAELRRLLEAGAIQLLVFYRMDRLGRTNALCQSVVALCLSMGCAVYNLSAPPQSIEVADQRNDSSLSLMSSFAGWQAQDEMTVLRRRHESGMLGRARRGLMPGTVPYGYRKDGDGYAIVPQEAAVIRRVVELCLSGSSTYAIAVDLNAEGASLPTNGPKRGREWHKTTVRYILRKVWTYAGYAEINRRGDRPYKRFKSEYIPPIITEQDAESVESVLATRRQRRHSRPPHPLSGCVRCDRCGRSMRADHNRSRFVCQCGNTCRMSHIMGEVYTAFNDLESNETYDRLALRVSNQREVLQSQLDTTRAEIQRVTDRKSRADDAYVDGFMPSRDYQRQASRLNTELRRLHEAEAQLQQQIETLPDAVAEAEKLRGIASLYMEILSSDNATARNQWMRKFVAVAVRGPDDVDVTLG